MSEAGSNGSADGLKPSEDAAGTQGAPSDGQTSLPERFSLPSGVRTAAAEPKAAISAA